MPLGYGYVERDATSFVDWGTIGKNLSDMLQNENKVREEKKAAIDKATNEYANTLANAPQGEHIGMNEWALKYANDAQQARLLQDKLLKSGQLSLRDYTIQRQNLLDGTDQTFNLTKEYQQEYKTKMEAYKNGETQGLTNFLMASAEGFSNFSDTQIYINPRDYTVSVGKMTRNPQTGVMEMSKNPNDFATINSLRNRIKATYKKYDAVGNIKGFVDGLGIELQTIANMGTTTKTGTFTEIFDVLQKSNLPAYKTFEQAETEAIKARLGTQYDYTSVLTENIKSAPNGKLYDYTFDENEAKSNKNLILLKTDPSSGQVTPQLTADQEKSVIEYMRTEARLMYDKKVTMQETSQIRTIPKDYPPQYMVEEDNKKDMSKIFARNLVDATAGGGDQIGVGLAALNTALGIQFDKGTSDLSYTYKSTDTGKMVTVPFTIPKGASYQEKKSFADAVGQLAKQSGYDAETISNEFMRLMKNKDFNRQDVGSSQRGEGSSGGASRFNSGSNFNWRGPFANPQ